MKMTGLRITSLVAVLLMTAAAGLGAAEPAEKSSPADPGSAEPGVRVQVRVGDAPGQLQRLSQLSDFHLAAWVILENDVQVRVSQYAEEHAQNEEVRNFAQRMVDSHRDLITTLRAPFVGEDRDEGEFDFGEVLQDISQRLAESESTSAARGAERDVNQRSTDNASAVREGADAGRQRDETRAQRREERRARADRSRARESRVRNRLNDVLPVLRDNLPQILDVLGDAIEGTEAEVTGLAFIQLKRQLTDKLAKSMIDELGRSQGAQFDQAYLGWQVVAHLKMIDTIEVARQHASPALVPILDRNIESMENQLAQARTLMTKVK